MDHELLDILVCPLCKGQLKTIRNKNVVELWCTFDKLAYPVVHNKPIMLPEYAHKLSVDESLQASKKRKPRGPYV